MRFKPPLTKETLHAIRERNGGVHDMAALLWEIARLRGTVLYADQLQRLLGTLSGVSSGCKLTQAAIEN